MSESRASLLGIVDWLVVFATVPLALALILFPVVWAPGLTAMYEDFGSTLPASTQLLLGGVLPALWGLLAVAVTGVGCLLVRAPLGLRRAALVGALLWSCLGATLTWLAVYLPIIEMADAVRY